jgi:hypothetical protein
MTPTSLSKITNILSDTQLVTTLSNIDNVINNKADKSEIFTKTQTTILLNNITLLTVFTKTETTNLLNDKALACHRTR